MAAKEPELVYCKKCGRCCRSSGTDKITLSKYDVKRLHEAGVAFKTRKDHSVFKFVMENGKCGFLGDKGCTLPYELRPLDCKTYPVHFIPDGKREYVTIAADCPSWSKIPEDYIAYAKKLARKEFKHWTKKERTGYWV